jgi:hypothetical protein
MIVQTLYLAQLALILVLLVKLLIREPIALGRVMA